jgi:hypothetical protein
MDNGRSEKLAGMRGSLSGLRFESASMGNDATVALLLGEPYAEEQYCSGAEC